MPEDPNKPMKDFMRSLIVDRFTGLLIRSFAEGPLEEDYNIVMLRWTDQDYVLGAVDDEGRLSRTNSRSLKRVLMFGEVNARCLSTRGDDPRSLSM